MKTERLGIAFHNGRVTLFALLILAIAGCSEKPAPAARNTRSAKVVIKGSNTVGEELGPKLIAEYKKEHPDANFDLESKGTGSGFWALLGGQCDLAAASRVPNPDELKQAKERKVQFSEHPIGYYSFAIVVNAGNPITDLSSAQVRDIFTGTIQNWKEVGGPDAAIHVNIRNPISGTYLGFQELAMENKAYAPVTNAFMTYGEIVQAVAQDANGIGYVSFDLIQKPGLKPLSIGGIAPSNASVQQGKYPYARRLCFYSAQGKDAGSALDFVKFAQSEKGQQIVAGMGNVPKM